MTDREDILFGVENDEYDVLIRHGDFVIGQSNLQHVSSHNGGMSWTISTMAICWSWRA